MRKRYLGRKATLKSATNDELFTELIKRLQDEHPAICYFTDQTTAEPFPTWSIHYYKGAICKIAVKEIK
jgi:hypothetical protein